MSGRYLPAGVTLTPVRPHGGDFETYEVRRDTTLVGFVGRHSRRTKPSEWVREMSRGRHASQVTRVADAFSAHLVDGVTASRGRVVTFDAGSLEDAVAALLRAVR